MLRSLHRVALLWGFVIVSGFDATSVLAAPSLILFADNGSRNPVYRQAIENLGAVIVANNLGRYYDHVDVLTGAQATRERLFAQVHKRGAKSWVDLVILTHGVDRKLLLSDGGITDRDIREAGPFPRLRMVYMMACYGASLTQVWRDAGAQIVVGHQDINSLPGFFFPRYLRRWAEGATARQAAEDAHRFSESTAALLSSFIHQSELLNEFGIARSEPVLRGVDMDRKGRAYPSHALEVSSTVSGARASSPEREASGAYEHTDFERTGIELLGAMIPQASLKAEAIPSAQELVERIEGVAWAQLRDSFPDPGVGGLELPASEGEQIWIDGEAVRFLVEPLRGFAGELLSDVLDRLQGVRLTRRGGALKVAIYFDRSFVLSLEDEKRAQNWQPYALDVPQTVRMSVRMVDGVMALSGLDKEGVRAVTLRLKMPGLPDSVWLRSASLNLADGQASVEAGVIGNAVSVVAKAQVLARRFEGVDVWESIARNWDLFVFPGLRFALR